MRACAGEGLVKSDLGENRTHIKSLGNFYSIR
jgi:hypothetical protein